MHDTVTVVLPTHNRPHTIAYSIAAVLRQTHASLALHVVGDGCDDRTEAVVRGFDDRRVHFHRFAKGHGYGYGHRNRILRETADRYVAYATDDDLWLPDHLEHALAACEQRSLDLVATRSAHVRASGDVDPHFFAFDWRRGALAEFVRHWFLGAVTIVHRRSLFDRIGYWDDALARFGDREMYHRACAAGVPVAYVDHVTVLRFYARHWDARYAGLPEPPQRRFLDRLGDDHWRRRLRAAAAPGRRSLAVRREQWRDFMRFAMGSGPKFARFRLQRWRFHELLSHRFHV
jgi:glycosyltransferase involved in cell wall biosynthesis